MQTPEQIAEQLVADWQSAEKMPPLAWDFRGFAAEAVRRAAATGGYLTNNAHCGGLVDR